MGSIGGSGLYVRTNYQGVFRKILEEASCLLTVHVEVEGVCREGEGEDGQES